jgi:mannosyltransferase OCH1-like enzyme
MIPKKIHQIYFPWNGPLENIPIFVESIRTMKEMHPDWEYKLWGAEDALALVKEHRPDLLDFYQSLRYNIQRVDFTKFLVLYVHGGFYCDLDSHCIQSLEPLRDKRIVLHSLRHLIPNHHEYVQNDFMASEPKSKFWEIIFDELVENYREKSANKIYDEWKGRFVLQTTGPAFLSRVVKDVLPSYKPLNVAWTKWHNDNWEKMPRENFYYESYQTASWALDVSPNLKPNKLFKKNEN